MKIEMLAEAAAELDEAVDYYALIRPPLSEELLCRFSDSVSNIERNHENHPRLETLTTDLNIRRSILKRFPYMIVFEILADEIRILAFAHTASQPNYWMDRRRDS